MRLVHKQMVESQVHHSLQKATHTQPVIGEAANKAGSAADCPNDEGLSGHVIAGRLSVNVPTAEYVRMELGLAPEIRRTLTLRQWMLVCAGEDPGGFVTADDPVTLAHAGDGSHGDVSSYGFAVRDNDVIFPVSHDLAVAGRFAGLGGTCVADRKGVALINGWTICHAWRQVYAYDEQCPYMVDEARGVRVISGLLADMACADERSEPL